MKNLKTLRLDKNITQKQVAVELNLSQQTYNYYENCKRQPGFDTLSKIAQYFNVSVDYLLGNDTPKDFGDLRDFTENELDEIKSFVKFIKSKRPEKHDSK